MNDVELAAHLAHVAGQILLQVRDSQMFDGAENAKALGKAGDQTANHVTKDIQRQWHRLNSIRGQPNFISSGHIGDRRGIMITHPALRRTTNT